MTYRYTALPLIFYVIGEQFEEGALLELLFAGNQSIVTGSEEDQQEKWIIWQVGMEGEWLEGEVSEK